jgi:2,4-dienoyl-CoA reductase-like NADH-dependent reductase (Old Yellow Enzyme family)
VGGAAGEGAIARLFEPVEAGGLALRNRIVMAPMTRRLAPDDRVPSEAMAAYYERRAIGGVGLIVTEGTHTDPVHAPDSERVPGLWNEAQRAGWRRVIERVHSAGGAIACQLWHTGRHAMDPIGPSPLPVEKRGGGYKKTPRQMTRSDMERTADEIAHAAVLAEGAGFDAIEIHGAHGYLLDSFLSPVANRRTDGFGGGFRNRARFPLMVIERVREAVSRDYCVMLRFSQWRVEDYTALAFQSPATLREWCGMVREAGVDILHVSTRDCTDAAFPDDPSVAGRTLAGLTREYSGLPTVAVGRVGVSNSMGDGGLAEVRDPTPAAELVERGEADLVAVGRGLIANPDWAAKVRAGAWDTLLPFDKSQLETLEDE